MIHPKNEAKLLGEAAIYTSISQVMEVGFGDKDMPKTWEDVQKMMSGEEFMTALIMGHFMPRQSTPKSTSTSHGPSGVSGGPSGVSGGPSGVSGGPSRSTFYKKSTF